MELSVPRRTVFPLGLGVKSRYLSVISTEGRKALNSEAVDMDKSEVS
jgi:hypothetical protein